MPHPTTPLPPAPGAAARALLATVVVVGATGLLGTTAVTTARKDQLVLDDVVALVVLATAALAAGVLAVGLLALTVSTSAHLLGGSLRAADLAARRLTPAVLRRVVTAGIGVGLGLGTAVSAQATEPDLLWAVTDQAPVSEPAAPAASPGGTGGAPGTSVRATHVAAPVDVGADDMNPGVGLDGDVADDGTTTTDTTATDATADAATATGASADAATASGATVADAATTAATTADMTATDATTADVTERVEVRRGDSLWSIAATHLGAGATDAEIAGEWPRWYEANRATIGADPDHIEPGQLLVAPGGADR